MEYSVKDLFCILLRRWYIVVLSMCIVGGLSIVSAKISYQQALNNYNAYTAESEQVEQAYGTTTAEYQYKCTASDISYYQLQANERDAFVQNYITTLPEGSYSMDGKPNAYREALSAYEKFQENKQLLPVDKQVMQQLQDLVDSKRIPISMGTGDAHNDEFVVADHFYVTQPVINLLSITVSGVNEASAASLINAYLDTLKEVGKNVYLLTVSTEKAAETYMPTSLSDPDKATATEFSKTVMAEPTPVKVGIRTIGTAAILAFLLSCFCILIHAFIKDSNANEHLLKNAPSKENKICKR